MPHIFVFSFTFFAFLFKFPISKQFTLSLPLPLSNVASLTHTHSVAVTLARGCFLFSNITYEYQRKATAAPLSLHLLRPLSPRALHGILPFMLLRKLAVLDKSNSAMILTNLKAETPQPRRPHRPSTTCDRHPEEHFTGFCPSCLCERLAVLDKSNSAIILTNLKAMPPQPPKAHRRPTPCHRHPEEHLTGLCPSCLCERLAVLDKSNSARASRKPPPIPTAYAALKAIFKPFSSNSSAGDPSRRSFFTKLRRTKSFLALKKEGLGFSGFSGISFAVVIYLYKLIITCVNQ